MGRKGGNQQGEKESDESHCVPGVPQKGKLALQHHGGFKNGKYSAASSLVQFRNISIKELKSKRKKITTLLKAN